MSRVGCESLPSVSLAFLYKARLCGTRKRLPVLADGTVFTAFLDGASPSCTGKRFAVFADGLGRAGTLGNIRPDSEQRNKDRGRDNPYHFVPPSRAIGRTAYRGN